MLNKRNIFLLFILVLDVVSFLVSAEKLVNSGYPIKGANPLRNNKINRGILCPNVAPGRTTVLAELWNSQTQLEIQTPYLNGQGGIYVYDTGTESILQVNATNGLSMGKYGASPGAITLGLSGVAYISPDSNSFVFDWTTMTQIAGPISNEAASIVSASFVPYNSQYMLRPNINDDIVPAVSFLDASSFTWSNSQPIVSPGVTKDVIVFNDSNGMDHFIAVGDFYDGYLYHVSLKSDLYEVNVTDLSLSFADRAVWPFISDDILYVVTSDSATHRFHIMNGTEILPAIPAPPQAYVLSRNGIVHNGKYVANQDGGSMFRLAEMFSNYTITEDYAFSGNPTFSVPDNVFVFAGYQRINTDGEIGHIQVVALDWDDWSIKAIGELPPKGSDPSATEVVFDENCQVSVVVGNAGNGVLYMLEPLPIQNIVPILECVDENNMAYFSYDNIGGRNFRMPFVADRNNLAPTGRTPVTIFQNEALHYPLSSRKNITSYLNQNMSWFLEDYTLSFFYTQGSLMCPSTINFTLVISSSSTFKLDTIGQAVRDAFIVVTKISSDRVVLLRVGSPKRSLLQTNDLEVELQVGPSNSTSEPSAAEVIQQFTENQQQQFNTELSNTSGAPADSTLTDLTTKQPSTAVRGTPNPVPEVPPTSNPQISTNNPPPPTVPVVSGSAIMISNILMFIVVLLISAL